MGEAILKTEYLIIGSSHAGLAAADEIRVNDDEGSLTMVTMEDILPYSPTVLPYIISGKVSPPQIYLRDEEYFKTQKIRFIKGKAVARVHPETQTVMLSDESRMSYEKLLIATGAEPTIPRVENLAQVPFLKLRTMDDALRHLEVIPRARSAIVMGTGLVGMHAAENFVHRGMRVDVARARVGKNPRILPNYFDDECSGMIQKVFESHGVGFYLTDHAVSIAYEGSEFIVTLSSGKALRSEMLLVCTGIKPRTKFLCGSSVEIDEGILVNHKMKTSEDHIWAAGDVAQAEDFFGPSKILNAILPDAVLQGKIAGADMSGGRLDSDYVGGISMNTFNFFGHRAFSIGMNDSEEAGTYRIEKTVLPSENLYEKIVFQGNVLLGMSAINSNLDPGIIMNLIKGRVDLAEDFAEFVSNPFNMSRRLMWKLWR
ncbi:MAG: FAD-dependent oxidoreductase [Deltaproteobacteria bacterium]|nr:FAD-dependent oxidoreductase [Deltaproteobacteria bacterium]